MGLRGYRYLIALAIAVICVAGWTGYGQRRGSETKVVVWEYKITIGLSEQQLNQLGSGGWELVAATETADQSYLYLKRHR